MSNDFNIKITGEWNFGNDKNIPENDETKKAADGLKTAFDGSADGKKMADIFKDGKVSNEEAELIMMEFEDEGITGLDDFDINDKEIQKFLKDRGVKDEALEAATKNMQTVISNIADSFKDAHKTTSVNEDYKAVTDIYTTDANTKTLAPAKDKGTQSVVFDETNKSAQTTIQDLIQDAYDFDAIFSVKDFPQFYETDNKGNIQIWINWRYLCT